MKRFKIHQSKADIVSQSGFALIGQAVKCYTNLSSELNTQVSLCHGIKHSDVIKSYLGLVCPGKNDFEAINTVESELFFLHLLISEIYHQKLPCANVWIIMPRRFYPCFIERRVIS